MSSRLYAPLYLGRVSTDPEKMAAHLNQKLPELELLIEAMRLSLAYGPLAGGYVPFFFSKYVAAGLAAAIVDVHFTPFNFRPLAYSIWVNDATSQLTVRLRYDDGAATDITPAGNLQFTGSVFQNARSDFDVDLVPAEAQVYLEVVSVGDGGTPVPTDIRASLWGKGCSRIEPT